MTGAALKGMRVVLRKPVLFQGIKSRSPNGKTTRVEITLECGHVENLKLSRIRNTRYRCAECSEKGNDSKVSD